VRAVRGRPVAENPGPGRDTVEHRTIAGALKKTKPVDHRATHVCHNGPVLADTTTSVPLLPPIDQWGALPLPLQRLSPHSLSRRARDLLVGHLGVHRDLPVDPDPEPEASVRRILPPDDPRVGAYDAADAAAAWDRRRRELDDLAGITMRSPMSNGARTS
jgi:hypothetical protein